MCRSHPIFCIVPPHLLKSVCDHGSARQRAWALKTMLTDSTFRALRATLAAPAPIAGRRRRGVVEEGQKQRTIYTARNEETLPGAIVRMEGGPPTGDAAVDEAYDGIGDTFDLYWEVYERNSIDDEGLPLDATVHYGTDYNNAFWNGPAHGVRRRRRRPVQSLQRGARRHRPRADPRRGRGRGAARVLLPARRAERVERRRVRLVGQAEAAEPDCGRGRLADRRRPVHRPDQRRSAALDEGARHRLRRPGARQGSAAGAHARLRPDYQDNGGVHINSGIPNHAFYLAAVEIGGDAWKQAGRIWYETLRDSRLRPNTGFKRFAGLTVDNAGRLYGFGSAEQQAVRHGWAEVGIRVSR
jgi:hypothetical protein